MSNEKFSITEALKYGWATFKANVPFFIGFIVALAMLTILPDFLADKLFAPRSFGLMVSKLVLRLIGLFLGMIATRISLDIHDTGQADLSRLGTLLPLAPYYLIGKILYALIVLVGLVLLIVPGIIVAYMFLYVGYIIVDRGMGPIDALQESRAITDGVKMDLFIFSIIIALLNLAGMVCLFVGLLVTIPTTMMASAYVYRKLSPAEPVAESA